MFLFYFLIACFAVIYVSGYLKDFFPEYDGELDKFQFYVLAVSGFLAAMMLIFVIIASLIWLVIK